MTQMDGSERRDAAVIGIGCRFPLADSAAAFWRVLCEGRDVVGDIPANRIDMAAYFDPRPATPGKMIVRRGGFLSKIDEFDAGFFDISPREAAALDPQQRILLETAWEALEDAGVDVASLSEVTTGVFIGQWTSDFEARLFADPRAVDFYAAQGSGRYTSSGRISYVLGLHGPSITLDTACSSSLVAVHLAARSIRSGESDFALVGAANLILQPQISIAYSQSRMMAEDGHCKFGDAAADGYVRSEGVAVIAIKSLDRAQRDGDRIYAVIRGSAVTNDGNSSGSMGTPSSVGQELLLRAAYRDAGIDPSCVGYVEAHGTGTRVGDPIELKSLAAVLGVERDPGQWLHVGSVKTNLGHTESVAGLAGLIKTCLVLRHGSIPPSLHFNSPNPLVPWDDMKLIIPRASVTWPRGAYRRFAGVTALGIAGTNAHVVLEEAPVETVNETSCNPELATILPLSAASSLALKQLALRTAEQLESEPQLALSDVCWSAAMRRSALPYRSAPVAAGRAAMIDGLRSLAENETSSPAIYAADSRKICFVCPGQGAQWPGMARQLVQSHDTFRTALEQCDSAAHRYVDFSLIEQIMAEPGDTKSRLDEITVIQPVLVALAIAYARLLSNIGIVPDAVLGHSMGEVAAAAIAGVLDVSEAMRIVCRRSALMQQRCGLGGMALVELSMDEVAARLAGREHRVSVAVNNSPRSCVLSGDPVALKEVLAELERDDVFARTVNVDVASHSAQMDAPSASLAAELVDLRPRGERIPIWSTVLGRRAEGKDFDAEYWGRNLRQPVRFLDAVNRLLSEDVSTFVELGPHPVLLHAVEQTAHAANRFVTTAACGRREEGDDAAFLGALGTLWSAGHALSWSKIMSGRFVPLPNYPWQREHHWADGAKLRSAVSETTTVTQLDDETRGWLHALRWRSSDPSEPSVAGRGERCLLIANDRNDEAEAALARAGEAVGADIEVVPWNGLEQALANEARAGMALANIVLVLPNDETASYAPVCALQAVLRHSWQVPPRLSVVTRGAQAIDASSRLSIDQAAAWGACRVIAWEHPELRLGLIDLDRQPLTPTAAAVAFQQILAPDREEQTAIRGDRRLVLRLESYRPYGDVPVIRWRSDAAYLITGGFGDIGLGVAQALAANGVRRLILMGRTPLPPRDQWSQSELGTEVGDRIAAVRALEAQGVAVHLAAVDVGDELALRAFFERYRAEAWPPVRGVIHAAVTLDNALASFISQSTFDRVVRAKLRSAQLLEQILPDVEVFVLMSSICAFLPQLGEVNYAAANAGLDALAQDRRARGLPAISLGWGVWKETGLAKRFITEQKIAEFASQGIKTIPPDRAFATFSALCGLPESHLAVLPLDQATFRRAAYHRNKAMVSRLVDGAGDGASKRTPDAEAPSEEEILQLVTRAVGTVLKYPPSRLDPRKPLGAMGLTSLMAIELRNLLEADLARSLSATLAWKYPTIEALVAHLAAATNSKADSKIAPVSVPVIAVDVAAMAQHSDEEALALLRGGNRR